MKPYIKPLITEVKLEDQEVASMANSGTRWKPGRSMR